MTITDAQIGAAIIAITDAQPLLTKLFSHYDVAQIARAALEAAEAAAWSTDMEAAPKDRPLLIEDHHSVEMAQWGTDEGFFTWMESMLQPKRWRLVPTPPTEGDR